MESLTPREIVEELDKYIVGQGKAKKGGGHSLKEPLPEIPACPGPQGRGGAQKHSHDRAHRGRQKPR